MKKIKNESALLQKAITVAESYAHCDHLGHLHCIVVIIKNSGITKRLFSTRVISNAIVSA
ncbi:MAG: hypothetical protein ACJAU4_001210 [Glaciecola sp.]|jgi:hypothetical protein